MLRRTEAIWTSWRTDLRSCFCVRIRQVLHLGYRPFDEIIRYHYMRTRKSMLCKTRVVPIRYNYNVLHFDVIDGLDWGRRLRLVCVTWPHPSLCHSNVISSELALKRNT